MPIGYLRIQAVTSRARVPVENATVTISGAGSGGRRELISVQLTDDSGQTPPVSIETPAVGADLSRRDHGAGHGADPARVHAGRPRRD